MRLDRNHDLTNEPNTVPAGSVRPTFRFDGHLHGAMMEREAEALGLGEQFAERFLRQRVLPVPFTSSVATDDGETAASADKCRRCYEQFCCTECGLAIAEHGDGYGWILQTLHSPGGFTVGSSLSCTSCMHAVCKFCPFLWVAVHDPAPWFELRRVASRDEYTSSRDGLTAIEVAPTFTYTEFQAYRAELLRTSPRS